MELIFLENSKPSFSQSNLNPVAWDLGGISIPNWNEKVYV